MEALYAPRTFGTGGRLVALGRLGDARKCAKKRQTGASTARASEPLPLLSGGRSAAGGNGECELPLLLGAGEPRDWHRPRPLQCQQSRQKRPWEHCVNGIWTHSALHWGSTRICVTQRGAKSGVDDDAFSVEEAAESPGIFLPLGQRKQWRTALGLGSFVG